MAIGIANSIHIISRYYQELEPGRSRSGVVRVTMDDLGLPVFVAAMRTVIGFATLCLSSIPAIRDFGVFSVLGITAIFVLTALFIPAALVVLPTPRRGLHHRTREDWVVRMLRRLGEGAIAHRGLVFALAGGACAISLVGASRMKVETDYLEFLSPTNPVRVENDRIAKALGGPQPVYVVIDGHEPQSVNQLETLQAMEDLQDFILDLPGVDSVVSLVDYVRLARGALDPEAPKGLP